MYSGSFSVLTLYNCKRRVFKINSIFYCMKYKHVMRMLIHTYIHTTILIYQNKVDIIKRNQLPSSILSQKNIKCYMDLRQNLQKDRRHNYNSNIIYSTHMAKQNYEGGWNIICSVLFCEINYIYTIFSKTLYLFIISQE